MGFLSKAWKGIKKAVKKVAKGVKKVAKGVVTSIPGGQKLWKAGGKIGKSIMKGIGKLGPVGIMAAQVLLSSTGIGAAISASLGSMWTGMGAMAQAAVANGSAIASALGHVGSAVFTAGNWAAGTLGAMGSAFSEGAAQIMNGNFSAGASTFASNMSSALSGEAGMAAVNTGIADVAALTAQEAAIASGGSNAGIQAAAEEALGSNSFELQDFGTEVPKDLTLSQQPLGIDTSAGSLSSVQPLEQTVNNAITPEGFAEVGTKSMEQIVNTPSSSSDLNKLGTKALKSLLGSAMDSGNWADASSVGSAEGITSVSPQTGGGQGSEGFSLLSGVRGLEQSVRHSTNLMFT